MAKRISTVGIPGKSGFKARYENLVNWRGKGER